MAKTSRFQKILLGLLFIILIILSNQLIVPHFSLLGLLYFKGIVALILTLFFFALILTAICMIFKKTRYNYYILLATLGALSINSFLNLLAYIFLHEDILNFVIRVFQDSELATGFAINQALLLIIGVFAINIIINKKITSLKK
ncbi:MAG: hypothetical protein ACOCQX_02930 [Candidatus Nanoarchaeia archaeon]